jgi:hypothetical protein
MDGVVAKPIHLQQPVLAMNRPFERAQPPA